MKYGIIGTGALGAFYGAKLVKAGCEVHFLLNSDYEHVASHGIRIDSADGDLHLHETFHYPSSRKMPPCDVLLVCLKTTQNHLLPELLNPILHRESLVILLQNGLGMEEDLALQLPDIKLAGALAFIAASKIAPGHFGHYAYGKLVLGDFSGGNQAMLERVAYDLRQAKIEASITPDLLQARWQKLVWNIPFSGLSVVLNTTTDRLLTNPIGREMVRQLMEEVVAAANHCRINLSQELPAQLMQMTDKMAPYAPSMKLDFDAKRPMELDYIYTHPIQRASACGYEMHRVALLEKQLRYLEQSR